MKDIFRKIANKVSATAGSPAAFIIATLVIIVWALSGPYFKYSDTWQLIINTGTTILTFLMVFLIQNTQNHDSKSIHLKLDELIKSIENARNKMIHLDDMTEDQLESLHKEFKNVKETVTGGNEQEKAGEKPTEQTDPQQV